MITVEIPKDLSKVKTKVAFNLTKRQLVCFSLAAICGIPVYIFSKPYTDMDAAAVLMILIMLPFFFLALYEKDGVPAEKILCQMIRHKFLLPGTRPYRAVNIYRIIEKEILIKKEMKVLERKESGNLHQKKTGKRPPYRK